MRKVYLVGAGPGDPDLITVKGLKAIQQADVILYDRLVNAELLNYAKKDAELVYCGKRPGHHSFNQEAINHLLCKFANQGKIVTRLKGGDPFIFGRGGEEAEALAKKQIPFEIVPGITSGAAAPAYAGIPLTHRDYGSNVAFVAGVTKRDENLDEYWARFSKVDTLCIYMGVKNLPIICEQLIKHGKDTSTPIALVHWGTTDKQQTVTGTLATICERASSLENPSLIIVGEVVRLREQLQWFEKLKVYNDVNAITG
ncbi:uroporphyrinogen-III C-methyltransferase [Heyndrickxia ginsengihumi]|uniref:Uroporphyrinogen-III C-methyltransferase n=1 Tax=Heyndrickxia ginsengihumi TaxID=363870 RepID=A0A0A6VEA7_9BACI|nr:uroporphyrinogen-III C-methyltransferase [Heyndrickxia ginsengihumi]KHD86615.1 uroporphyrin-III methyltransferase [Heyndrickxia ginsengihumi]MBE6185273.1 uroporphyrinogen-III C-methyltransferase [Bacillus sp. (in: firmicutes)]MCM3022651.1 uroporphyrinogen-III C-methyltransferase [Heyndrickxia ginsengihumi]NEY19010.1 uroporphyrinogen-III C-methyltransferase [Heyndrickxia ginsengihumi]